VEQMSVLGNEEEEKGKRKKKRKRNGTKRDERESAHRL